MIQVSKVTKDQDIVIALILSNLQMLFYQKLQIIKGKVNVTKNQESQLMVILVLSWLV